MKRKSTKLRLGAMALAVAMVGTSLPGGTLQVQAAQKADKVITISPENASPFNEGKFEGWGTSFCWWANRLGYNENLSQQVADLFYSKDTGLGLNIVRYNIGGGDDPTHDHITRTDSEVPGYWKEGTESYADGVYSWEYDWTKDANQRNVLQDCVEEYGDGIIVEAFSNSPPYFMTNSGCSTGATDANKDNLKSDAYDAFAKYMAEVSAHFRDEWDIEFQSITAMNEPYTNYWGAMSNKQEGCHFDQGASQSNIIVALKEAMDKEGFENIIYSGTDETSIDTQITSYEKLSTEAKEIITRIDSHTYSGSKYAQLKQTAINGNENLWMSEVDGGSTAGTNAGEMGSALWFANKIITDMNGLTPSAWIMWQIIDNHISKDGYNGNTDSGMPNTNGGFWGVAVADHDDNEVILTKKYYAFGQFTRYIRPGYTIIGGTANTLAALDKENSKLVIVATNTEAEDVTCDFDLSMFDTVGSKVEVIRTSGDMETGENWAELDPITTYGTGFETTLKANSITTYIVEGVTSSGESALDEIAISADQVTGSAPWNNNTANGCTNVVDGKLDTFFDGVGNGYVQFDLGEYYTLQAVAYAPRSGFVDRCVGASFFGSFDGNTWYPLTTITSTPSSELNYVSARAFENNMAFRYVKYAVPSADYNCNVAEIKLYGNVATEEAALASMVVALDDKISELEAIEQGFYTESSFAALTSAITAAKEGERDSIAKIQEYMAQLDAAYAALETGSDIPVSVKGTLPVLVVEVGEAPELPATVATTTKEGNTINSPVVWNDGYEFDTVYETVVVEGVVKGTELAVSQQIEVIPDPDMLVYYIDCAMAENGSLAYDAVAAVVTNLRNKVVDQAYDGSNLWGYAGIDSSYTGSSDSAKYFTGHYGANKSATPVTYTLPMDAGTYDITMLVHNWWKARTMKVEAVYTDSTGKEVNVPIEQSFNIGAHGTTDYQTINKQITIPNDTVLTLKFTANSGQDGAIVNFIGIVEVPQVNIDAEKVELNKAELTLVEGEKATLTATITPDNATDKNVIWSSDKEAVATVADGVVTAVAEGTATITVTTANGKTATCIVTVEKEEDKKEVEFLDIEAGKWYVEAVQYAYDNGFMSGVDTDENGNVYFSPDTQLKREQLAQILYAAESKPEYTTDKSFVDVVACENEEEEAWYVKAVLWAAENGIVSGIGDGKFGVDQNITREQLAQMLYRYAELKGYDIDKTMELTEFIDKDSVTWSETALKWAVANGVMSGKTALDGESRMLDPQGEATRAECAAMIRSFWKAFVEVEADVE